MRKRMNWIDWAGARKNMRRDESRLYKVDDYQTHNDVLIRRDELRLYNGKSLTD